MADIPKNFIEEYRRSDAHIQKCLAKKEHAHAHYLGFRSCYRFVLKHYRAGTLEELLKETEPGLHQEW